MFEVVKKPGIPYVLSALIAFTGMIAGANEIDGQVSEIQAQADGSAKAFRNMVKRESRYVPIVIPISNPTVGLGLGGGILYMHEKKGGTDPNDPSTMTGVFGMYTDTDSWAFGGFHSGSYKDDSIRVSVPVAHGDFSLKFYGIGDNSPLRDDPLDYDAAGNFFKPRVTFQLPFENWFAGALYRIINVSTDFDDSEDNSDDVSGYNDEQTTAGFGLVALYDSRNSNLWPSDGSWLDITGILNGHYAGGDNNYFKTTVKWAQYFPIQEALTLVYRLDGQFVAGEAPFWDLARVRLRGFASGQYLDNVAATAQAELRWKAYKRWHLSVFGGSGWIGDDIKELGSADANIAVGAGFRYMLVEDQKLSIGIDAAYAEDRSEFSVYFQVGDWLAN